MECTEFKQFDVVYANLDPHDKVGSEQSGTRPCVIVQNSLGNKYSPTIIVLPLTSQIKKLNQPTHCIVKKTMYNGLSQNSMVLGEAITTISKERVVKVVGFIDDSETQSNILQCYIANIMGKKNNVCNTVVAMMLTTIKNYIGGVTHGTTNRACDSFSASRTHR